MKQKYKGVLLEQIHTWHEPRYSRYFTCDSLVKKLYVWRIYWADGTIRQTLTRAAARRVIARELSKARS